MRERLGSLPVCPAPASGLPSGHPRAPRWLCHRPPALCPLSQVSCPRPPPGRAHFAVHGVDGVEGAEPQQRRGGRGAQPWGGHRGHPRLVSPLNRGDISLRARPDRFAPGRGPCGALPLSVCLSPSTCPCPPASPSPRSRGGDLALPSPGAAGLGYSEPPVNAKPRGGD